MIGYSGVAIARITASVADDSCDGSRRADRSFKE
jgi:hypothetical protein